MMDKNLEKMMGFRDPVAPKIKFMRVDELVPYERNSKAHSKGQIELIKNSMLEWGWTVPVLADANGIVAGHGRQMAARALYDEGKQISFPDGTPIPIGYIPVLHCDGWDEKRRRAYIIADNQLTMADGWLEDMLKLEVQELNEVGFDLDLLGFDEDQLNELLKVDELEPSSEKDPDDIPGDREDVVSFPGDIWVCGPHKIICGDSTDLNVWDSLMNGERADAAITDPPYNVDLGRKNKLIDKTVGGSRNANGSIANDKMSEAEFTELLAGAYAALYEVLKPGATVYVSHPDKYGSLFRDQFESAGFKFSQSVIWRKSQLVLGMAPYQPIHEPIMVGRKPGSRHKWYGGRKQTTVIEAGEGGYISRDEDGRWLIKVGDAVLVVDGDARLEEHPLSMINVPKPAKSDLHPSTKPVELWEKLLKNSARPGDIIVDGFSGSGTTMIAADRLGMIARVVELEPSYTDTAVRRWQDYTGRKAVNFLTGEPFPDDGVVRDRKPDTRDDKKDPDIF